MSLMKSAARKVTRRPLARRPLVRAAHTAVEGLEGRRLFAGQLALVNPFALPASDRLVFNRVGNPNTFTPANVVHDQQVLTLRNTGATALNVEGLTLSGPFTFVSTSATPVPEGGFSIAPGGTRSVTIQFTQASVPSHATNQTNFTDNSGNGAFIGGSLTIASDDPTTPTKVVSLAGYYQKLSNNNQEPSLQTIVNRLGGYQTSLGLTGNDVDFTQPDVNGVPTAKLYGSEVYSADWSAANPATPVTVQQVAAFHTQGNTGTLYWYVSSTQRSNRLFASTGAQAQTVLPTTSNGGTTPLTASFNPNGAFGLRVDSEYSNDAINVAAGNSGGGGHHMRFFPLVDQSGTVVPNAYLVGMDYGQSQAQNFDFQDNVYLVTNIRPSTTPDTPTNLTATRGSTVTLTWTASASTPVSYNVYRATAPDGPYTLLTASPIPAATYTDAGVPAGILYYRVTAVDTTRSTVVQSAAATVRANAGPVPADYTFSAVTNQPFTFNPLANVTDPSGTVAPATVAISTATANATVTVDPTTGEITYQSRSGYTGADTFQYTVADSNGDRSLPGTVTVNVASTLPAGPTDGSGTAPSSGLTTSPIVTQAIVNTPLSIDVLSVDTGTNAATLAVTAQPGNGNAVVNGSTITFTPGDNVVGRTSFTYSVSGTDGGTSSNTVTVSVGVPIGTNTAFRKLTYTSGTDPAATVALNRGTANVYFNGTGTLVAKGTTATVTGTDMYVRGIGLSGTTAATALSIRKVGNGTVRFGGVWTEAAGAALGVLNAPTADLQNANSTAAVGTPGNAHPEGQVDLAGARKITLRSATNAAITIDGGTPTALSVVTNVAGTSYTTAVPVTTVKAANWTGVAGNAPGPITAPSINSLVVPGTFTSDLTLTTGPSGNVKTLGNARVGTAGEGAWSIAGNVGSVTAGSAAPTFGPVNVGGNLARLSVNTGDLLTSVTADTLGTLRVAGTMAGDVHTAGNANVITVGGLNGSAVTVGTNATLAGATATNIGAATLRALRVTGRGASAFNDSTVIAGNIGSIVTGPTNAATTNPEGLAADTVRSATVGVNNGNVRLNAASLANADALAAYLQAKGLTLGEFDLRIV